MVLSAVYCSCADAVRREARCMLAIRARHPAAKLRISRELCALSRVGVMNQAVKESTISAKTVDVVRFCLAMTVLPRFWLEHLCLGNSKPNNSVLLHRHKRCELMSIPRLLLEIGSASDEKPRLVPFVRRPIVRRHLWYIETSKS